MSTSSVYSYRGLDGRSYLALAAKRRYVFRHGARAEPASEPAVIQVTPDYRPLPDDEDGRLLFDTDLVAGIKPATDVLLRGSAHSHRGLVPSLSTALRVGSVAKTIAVLGDRSIRLDKGGSLTLSDPEPFTTMPLVWERAYGGRDTHAEAKEAASAHGDPGSLDEYAAAIGSLTYPRNRFGRGYFLDIDRERLAGSPAPNLEDPSDPVRPDRLLVPEDLAWIDCPVAACFEPIDLLTFPRALFFIPAEFNAPSRPIHEVTTGVLSKADLARMDDTSGTFHPRSFNCAPAGLATHRGYGAERVQLWNLHPLRELFEFDLPGDRPRLVLEPPGTRPRELEALLQTVLVEPELDRVTLTWAGVMEVAMVYPVETTDTMRHGVVWGR